MTSDLLRTKLQNIYLHNQYNSLTQTESEGSALVTIEQKTEETPRMFMTRVTDFISRLNSAFIVIGTYVSYDPYMQAQIEFTWGVDE